MFVLTTSRCATFKLLGGNTVFLINAPGNQTDKPPPNAGEVIQMPQTVTEAGKSLQTIKPGDVITSVFRQQAAIDANIIR